MIAIRKGVEATIGLNELCEVEAATIESGLPGAG